MKRLLLMTLLTTICIFARVLYGGYTYHERTEEIPISQEYINPYPEAIPNIVLDPMTHMPF